MYEHIKSKHEYTNIIQSVSIFKNSFLNNFFNSDIDLLIARDDLYPFCGGGSKARKMQYIICEIENAGYDIIVTNGGPQSNHARAAALMAAEKGIPCHLVIVLEDGVKYPISGNLLLMILSGATLEYCIKEELSERMDLAIQYYKEQGYNPAYIWGGGHCHSGTVAFVEAAKEAREQCCDWIPDYVVHASGTGTTQAGLAIGYADLPTKVIGISVARDTERGAKVIQDTIDSYFDTIGYNRESIDFDFRDDWICGGYEKTAPELMRVVHDAARKGLILDPTYSGKAFYGLTIMIRNGEIPEGSKELFWHTGGLMNLMASQLAHGYVSI